MRTLKQRLAAAMRTLADRIDREGAPKLTHRSFTFEHGRGLVFREDGNTCPVACLGAADFERAHAEADNPAMSVPLRTLAKGGR